MAHLPVHVKHAVLSEKHSLFVFLVGVVAATGCEGDLSAASVGAELRPLPVEVHVLRRDKRRPETRLIAQLEPHRRAFLRSRITATVERVSVQLGARVKRKALLVKLGDQALGLRLSAARARRRGAGAGAWRARRQYRRVRKLVRMGALPRAQLDRARSALRQARAGWHAQDAELAAAGSQRRLRAPFSGWIAELFVKVGDEVNVGQPLLSVVDTTRLRARVGLSPQEAEGVSKGDPCQLRVSRRGAQGLASQLRTGRVLAVGIAVNVQTRRVPVEIEVEAGDGALKAGMLAETTLYTGRSEEVLLIPEGSIVSIFDVPYAFVVQEGHAKRRRLQLTGRRWGSRVEVHKGLSAGETLVVVGQHRLSPEVKVQIVEPEGKSRP
ncbi:MAG: efflux RND transporter periplasmic adaptor subunit [Deltaproteobacteria bacterium]|nr:efflux RND transporter periplasmic adaptor subunit [Deltaproteobacteria bacterium]